MKSLAFAVLLSGVGLALGIAVLRGDDAGSTRNASPKPQHQSPVTVAAEFLSGLDLDRLMDDRRRSQFIAAHAEPAARDRLSSVYANEAHRVRTVFAARPRVSRAAFLGYRLERPNRSEAVVSLWVVSLGGAGTAPLAVGWRTMSVRLFLLEGEWKVASVDERPGPQPDMTADRFAPMANRFEEFRVAP